MEIIIYHILMKSPGFFSNIWLSAQYAALFSLLTPPTLSPLRIHPQPNSHRSLQHHHLHIPLVQNQPNHLTLTQLLLHLPKTHRQYFTKPTTNRQFLTNQVQAVPECKSKSGLIYEKFTRLSTIRGPVRYLRISTVDSVFVESGALLWEKFSAFYWGVW